MIFNLEHSSYIQTSCTKLLFRQGNDLFKPLWHFIMHCLIWWLYCDDCDCLELLLHVKKRHHMIQSCKSSELGPHPSYFRCFKTEVWQRLRSVRSSGRWPAWAANERVGQRKAGPQPCYVKAGVGNGRLRKVTSHLSTESGGTWKVSSGTLSSISCNNNNNSSIWLCL